MAGRPDGIQPAVYVHPPKTHGFAAPKPPNWGLKSPWPYRPPKQTLLSIKRK